MDNIKKEPLGLFLCTISKMIIISHPCPNAQKNHCNDRRNLRLSQKETTIS